MEFLRKDSIKLFSFEPRDMILVIYSLIPYLNLFFFFENINFIPFNSFYIVRFSFFCSLYRIPSDSFLIQVSFKMKRFLNKNP